MVRSDTLKRAIAHALASAPGLGAFAAAVGVLGFDGAVKLCSTRKPSPDLLAQWETVGYRVEQLPSAEEIRRLIIGIEVRHALCVARTSKPSTPIADVVKELGHAQSDVNLGLGLVRSYNVHTMVTHEELGAI